MIGNKLGDLIVVKRSGQRVIFNGTKIAIAIKSSFDDIYETYDENKVNFIYNDVISFINKEYENRKTINVEDIQDIIENKLKEHNFTEVYDNFSKYRERRRASRATFQEKQQHKFVKVIEEVNNYIQSEKSEKPFDSIGKLGKAIIKEYAKSYLIDSKFIRTHDDGSIYIHDLDVYALSTISMYHIDLSNIKDNDIRTYTSKIKDILINMKKDVSGSINIPSFDKLFYNVALENYKKLINEYLADYLTLEGFEEYFNFKKLEEATDKIEDINVNQKIFEQFISNKKISYIFQSAIDSAYEKLHNIVNDNIKDLLLNLNNIKTFIKNNKYSLSIDVSNETMITDTIINILDSNVFLDNVSVIFKIKNKHFNEKLLKTLNKNIYILNTKEDNLEYFDNGCKVYENYWNASTSLGKMVNFTVTINLPRIGLISKTKKEYFENLDDMLELSKAALLQKFEMVANKYKEHFDYLFNNEVFANYDLEDSQKIRKIIKNGSLQIGFLGLYESVIAICKKFDEEFAFEVVKYMSKKCNEFTESEKLNFMLTGINDMQISTELLKIDKSVYGNILNITDKKKYNSGYNIPCLEDFNYIKNMDKYVLGGSLNKVIIPKKSSNKKIIERIETVLSNNVNFFYIDEGREE